MNPCEGTARKEKTQDAQAIRQHRHNQGAYARGAVTPAGPSPEQEKTAFPLRAWVCRRCPTNAACDASVNQKEGVENGIEDVPPSGERRAKERKRKKGRKRKEEEACCNKQKIPSSFSFRDSLKARLKDAQTLNSRPFHRGLGHERRPERDAEAH